MSGKARVGPTGESGSGVVVFFRDTVAVLWRVCQEESRVVALLEMKERRRKKMAGLARFFAVARRLM